MKTKKIAAIDIGSNAMRLLINNVIEYQGQKYYKKVDIVRVPIRLGTEAFKEKKISTHTSERLLNAMHAYKHLMDAHEIEIYRGCATSAMREAQNGAALIEKIKTEMLAEFDKVDLRSKIRQRLKDEGLSDKGGAGLGLLTIAKKAEKGWSYRFDLMENDMVYFQLNVSVPMVEK